MLPAQLSPGGSHHYAGLCAPRDDLHTIHTLASQQLEAGAVEQALPLAAEAVVSRRMALGDEHPDTLRSMRLLAHVHAERGELIAAESSLQEALKVSRRTLGDEHVDTQSCINDLAGLYESKMGGYVPREEVLKLREESLKLSCRTLGHEHADTLSALFSVAKATSDISASRALLQQALEAQRKVLGADHPDTVRTLQELGAGAGNMTENNAHRCNQLHKRKDMKRPPSLKIPEPDLFRSVAASMFQTVSSHRSAAATARANSSRPASAPTPRSGRLPGWSVPRGCKMLVGGRGGVPGLGPTGADVIVSRTHEADRTRARSGTISECISAVSDEVISQGTSRLGFSLVSNSKIDGLAIVGLCSMQLKTSKRREAFNSSGGWGFAIQTGALVHAGEVGDAQPLASNKCELVELVVDVASGTIDDTLSLLVNGELKGKTVLSADARSRDGYCWAVGLTSPGQSVRVHVPMQLGRPITC